MVMRCTGTHCDMVLMLLPMPMVSSMPT